MIDENLIASLGLDDSETTALLSMAFGSKTGTATAMDDLLGKQIASFTPGSILDGRVIGFAGDDVVVEVGLKSEGLIPREEFDNAAELKVGPIVTMEIEGCTYPTRQIAVTLETDTGKSRLVRNYHEKSMLTLKSVTFVFVSATEQREVSSVQAVALR